jgi:hypothetical protein
MEIAAGKKHFIVWLFIVVCLLSSCAATREISERINESSFKNKVKARFNEDFPAYKVDLVVIENVNQREKAAAIYYGKPDVKETFTAKWKYYDKDENPDNSKEDWQLVEKGGERKIGMRKD